MYEEYILLAHKSSLYMHSLKQYTTFAIDVQAKELITLTTEMQLQELVHNLLFQSSKNTLIIWWWSNILFTQDFDGVILINKLMWRNIIKETDKHIIVTFWSGEIFNDIVERSVENNYSWIENLISIPGTIGAAPVQNIGAYGVEIRDRIIQVDWIDLTNGETKTYTNEQCDFWYRDSIFKNSLKNSFFITKVTLQLTKVDNSYDPKIHYGDIETMLLVQWRDGIQQLTPKQVAQAIADIRYSKLPDWKKIGTAGSFFQNPIVSKEVYNDLKTEYPDLVGHIVSQEKVKLSAGNLIELAGLKWYRDGDAAVYDKHALVLVNYGNATWEQMKNLIHLIQTKVYDMFKIRLQAEVNIY